MLEIILCGNGKEGAEIYKDDLEHMAVRNNLAARIRWFSDPERLLAAVQKRPGLCDILYLDMNVHGRSGTDVAEELRNAGFTGELIFILDKGWNPIRQLQRLFDVQAMDCIVRGMCEKSRWEAVFRKAVEKVECSQEEQMILRNKGEYRYIAYSDISYFEVQNRIVTVYYKGGKEFSFYGRLDELAEQLEGRGFVRIHRSFIVNAGEITGRVKRKVELITGTVLPVGGVYDQQVKALLEESHSA